ncbi:MAG: phosphate regulon sensor histidine kinase PhoR [Arenimonas sp.]|nr:phosphate regulon sensor histidine kinase PhoR [Arenimonas sp.]
MGKATLTALAWHQSWILWSLLYCAAFYAGYVQFGWLGVLWAWAILATLQVLRAYGKLARLLNDLESRSLKHEPNAQGVWAALETLIIRRNRENRQRISRLAQMLRGYRLAAGAMPEGALVVNRRTLFVVWSNKIAKKMLGISPADNDIRLFELFKQPQVKDWFSASDIDQPLLNIEAPKDSATNLDMYLLPYTAELSLVVLRDSTKMRKLEQIRSDFVANVSHELRTPLTVIHGYLELIEQQDNPELQTIILEMQKQSQRMNHLVEDLLNLSRLESEKELPEEIIQSSGLLNTLLQEAHALSQNRHSIGVSDEFKGALLGSPKDVHSAFSNLVSNAVRYTPAGGSIAIGMSPNAAGGVDFYVKDTGFGIPANHISRLTERFYRISTSRSRELGGTGLGLSICKHVLNLHQAELIIQSEAGKGSTFTCRFPKKRIA